ncbi:hypothetical protein ALQ02_200011 [Pseudomonas savastanoi pv. phaseolicola]|nr:hypothetical protein ALQ02_200011 [Pseudomonas savastanoi pv. phaseolicola]
MLPTWALLTVFSRLPAAMIILLVASPRAIWGVSTAVIPRVPLQLATLTRIKISLEDW